MELKQSRSVTQNVYDGGERGRTGTRTEDVYQSLQYPPPTAQRTAEVAEQPDLERKLMLLFLVLNCLLLTIILSISAVHYSHFRQSLVVVNRPDTLKEMWHLHDDMFYLFWTNPGNRDDAERFCTKRKARLATLTEPNMAWLLSMANGKHLLVKAGQSDMSGEFSTLTSHQTLSQDEDDYDYDLLNMTPELSMKQVEGWVCERAAETVYIY